MQKKIRRGTFETNSSSAHSISLMKERQEWNVPRELHFHIHDFNHYPDDGDDMDSVYGRANYLYAAAIQNEEENVFRQAVKDALDMFGYKTFIKFQPVGDYDPDVTEWDNKEDSWYADRYHINHQAHEDARDLLHLCLDSPIAMMNYLFSDTTEVQIAYDGDSSLGVHGGDERFLFGWEKRRGDE